MNLKNLETIFTNVRNDPPNISLSLQKKQKYDFYA